MRADPAAPRSTDRFGNVFAPGLPYARGRVVTSTEDDFRKLEQAQRVIHQRINEQGLASIFNFSGLDRALAVQTEDLPFLDDELAPALYAPRFRTLALAHLGGVPDLHEIALFNRVTAATFATHLELVRPGSVVVGISASYSHPTVVRAAAQVGARFLDTSEVETFTGILARQKDVALVVATRLAVTYDILPVDVLRRVVELAHQNGTPVYMDDAGGARVGPAAFDQPRMLELGVDVGATGLDKYGTAGPRLGLLGGAKHLVERIRARAFEFGLEARPMLYPAAVRSLDRYTPERVHALIDATKQVATALRAVLGDRLYETPVTGQLKGEDTLELAMERAGLQESRVVPSEATAALAMLLLRDHGILTVHFAGIPPGTSNLLFKFVPPETLTRFGGPEAFARAVDASLDTLAAMIGDPNALRHLLLGEV